jgi:ectoine hydroxylase-related dioxygenase (phytanoyl-CoA dioxygenase family)
MFSTLHDTGFLVVPDVFSPETVDRIRISLEQEMAGEDSAVSRRGDSVYALRNVLSLSETARRIAGSEDIRRWVIPVLGDDCLAVRGILFDKTPGANWNVVWHQDLSLAVRERREIPEWGPWSIKAGVVHVQPPAEVLARMLTVRLHLDACGPENGPLRVLPGTHRMGRLKPAQIAELREQIPEQVCTVGKGGAVLLRPLLLHASSDSTMPGHRRVLHLEFAAGILPQSLEWKDQIGAIAADPILDYA